MDSSSLTCTHSSCCTLRCVGCRPARGLCLPLVRQAGGLAFALWKLNGMGLLPTHASDYVSALAVPRALEFSSGGVQLRS